MTELPLRFLFYIDVGHHIARACIVLRMAAAPTHAREHARTPIARTFFA